METAFFMSVLQVAGGRNVPVRETKSEMFIRKCKEGDFWQRLREADFSHW